jgi:hypothetical protein
MKMLVALVLILQGCTYVDVEVGGDVIIDTPMPLWPLLPPQVPKVFREGFYNLNARMI